MSQELKEEQEMNRCLRANQAELQTQLAEEERKGKETGEEEVTLFWQKSLDSFRVTQIAFNLVTTEARALQMLRHCYIHFYIGGRWSVFVCLDQTVELTATSKRFSSVIGPALS